MARPLALVGALAAAAAVLAACGTAPVPVQPFAAEGHWQPGLVGLPQYGPSGLGPQAAAASASPSPSASLSDPTQERLASVGLQPDDIAAGYTIAPIENGLTVDGVSTLDFCGGSFPSEASRVNRRQVAVFTPEGNAAGLSSEAVEYSSPEAAAQAIAEIAAARKACPEGTPVSVAGTPTTFTFHSAPGPSEVPLVPAPDRAVIHATVNRTDGAQHLLLVYQRVGNLLVGLYAFEKGDMPFNQSALDSGFRLAGRVADRMRAATSGTVAG